MLKWVVIKIHWKSANIVITVTSTFKECLITHLAVSVAKSGRNDDPEPETKSNVFLLQSPNKT